MRWLRRNSMIIYGSSVSPYVRKVVAFAAEKGLEFKVKGVTLNSQDPGFREASPFAKMPALRDGDYLLADSSAIVAYMVNGAAYPKLQAFVDKMLSRPSFARSLAHEAKILAG
jgi:glutathione S-transferase